MSRLGVLLWVAGWGCFVVAGWSAGGWQVAVLVLGGGLFMSATGVFMSEGGDDGGML